MTTNRLAKSENSPVKMTLHQVIDHANAHLAQIGRAHELEWVILNGSTHIQWRR